MAKSGNQARKRSGGRTRSRKRSDRSGAFLRSLGLIALGAVMAFAATTYVDLPALFDTAPRPKAKVEQAARQEPRSRMPAVKRPDRSIETAAIPVPRPKPQVEVKKHSDKPKSIVLRPPGDIKPKPKAGIPEAAPKPGRSVRPETVRLAGLNFPICGEGPGSNCVVDGDTFVLNGKAIRVADIDTPESGEPKCQREAMLAAKAKRRLKELLNAGPIELRAIARDEDIYGRKLRTVHRDDRSLGDMLISEGLAHKWIGRKQSWCA